jgi:hypothetical protein
MTYRIDPDKIRQAEVGAAARSDEVGQGSRLLMRVRWDHLVVAAVLMMGSAALHAQPVILGPPCVYQNCAPGYSQPSSPPPSAARAPVYTCWSQPDARNTIGIVAPWVEYRASEEEIIDRLTNRWGVPFQCTVGTDYMTEQQRYFERVRAFQREGHIVRPLPQ